MTEVEKYLEQVRAATKVYRSLDGAGFRFSAQTSAGHPLYDVFIEAEKMVDRCNRLVEMVETLRAQRDGYRTNYWALCRPDGVAKQEIIEDDDAALDRIAAGAAP